jgi:hypothetical protein
MRSCPYILPPLLCEASIASSGPSLRPFSRLPGSCWHPYRCGWPVLTQPSHILLILRCRGTCFHVVSQVRTMKRVCCCIGGYVLGASGPVPECRFLWAAPRPEYSAQTTPPKTARIQFSTHLSVSYCADTFVRLLVQSKPHDNFGRVGSALPAA